MTVLPSDNSLLPTSCLRVCRTRSSGTQMHQTLTCLGPPPLLPPRTSYTFWEALLAHGGEWMWNNVQHDVNDSLDWLLTAYRNGSLLWVTDGSYNSKLAPEVSGVGWIVHNTASSCQWSFSFTEISPEASSY
jgi:hypothetical protein